MSRAAAPFLRSLAGIALVLALAPGAVARTARAGEEPRDVRSELAAFVETGDDEGLLRAADAVLAGAPRSLAALEYRAYALQRLGRPDDAQAAYEGLLALDAGHVWALTRLGALHAAARRFDVALRHLQRAVELRPADDDAQRELVAALRGSGDLPAAQETAAAFRTGHPAAGWAWRAEAELAWMQGEIDAAAAALDRAVRLGTADTARLREMIDLDVRLLAASDTPDEMRAAWARRELWTFDVGGIVVRSSVGPRLPGDLVRMLRELPPRFSALVGSDRRGRAPVVVRVSRTLDEHEVLRRLHYPQGSVGRAFTKTSDDGGPRAAGVDVSIYLSWTSADVKTALAHELAHAAVRGAARDVPVWLDEGLATYLETLRHADDDVDTERRELESLLRDGVRDGRVFAWPRMLAAQRNDFEGADGRLRYAQARSMVQFLLCSPDAGPDAETRRSRMASMLQTARRQGRGPGRGGWADWSAWLESTYASPLEALETAWRASLE